MNPDVHYSLPRRNSISARWNSPGFSMCGMCPQFATTTSVPCGISCAAARPSPSSLALRLRHSSQGNRVILFADNQQRRRLEQPVLVANRLLILDNVAIEGPVEISSE